MCQYIYRLPRRKNPKPKTIEEVIEDILTAENYFNDEIKNIFGNDNSNEKPEKVKPEKVEPQNDNSNLEKKRDELLKLAEDGDWSKSVAYTKKASQKVKNKLYTEYERKRIQKANEFLTDLLISKFSNILGGLDAIESPEELTKYLKKDEKLKRDVHSLDERIIQFIPFLGFLSDRITTAKHFYGHKTNQSDETIKEVVTEN